MVQATDENRHSVALYSRAAAEGCLRGDSTDVLAQNLQRLVEKRVAAKAKADAQTIAQDSDPSVWDLGSLARIRWFSAELTARRYLERGVDQHRNYPARKTSSVWIMYCI